MNHAVPWQADQHVPEAPPLAYHGLHLQGEVTDGLISGSWARTSTWTQLENWPSLQI